MRVRSQKKRTPPLEDWHHTGTAFRKFARRYSGGERVERALGALGSQVVVTEAFRLDAVGPDFEKLSERIKFREVESTQARLSQLAAISGRRNDEKFRRQVFRVGLAALETAFMEVRQ